MLLLLDALSGISFPKIKESLFNAIIDATVCPTMALDWCKVGSLETTAMLCIVAVSYNCEAAAHARVR